MEKIDIENKITEEENKNGEIKEDKNIEKEQKEVNNINEQEKNKEKNMKDSNVNDNNKNREENEINKKINEDNKSKNLAQNNDENSTFSIDLFLKESNNINKDKKENKNQSSMDKRRSIPVNSTGNLKLSPISLDDDDIKNESKNNNKKTNHSSVERSFSQAIIPTKKYSLKNEFYNELLEDPKYIKVITLKEETETALKKTVGNKGSANFLKSLVSKKKERFCYDNFDLDLTYITMKIIAMGFPSIKIEGLYRNNMEDVKRFFNVRHPKHHKVYNLCEEKQYPNNCFYRQGYFPFPDHEAPPLNELMKFCQDAKKFLDENELNVVAIHCKAGKGRTGTFICCLLLYLGIFDTMDECLKYYGLMRVGEEKGVTIPSQKRYVYYFEQIIKNKIKTPLTYKSVCIRSLKMYTVPSFAKIGFSCTPTFIIENAGKTYKYSDYHKKQSYNCQSVESIDFPLNISFTVTGDVLITFYHIQFFGNAKMFKFWFNTNFLPKNGVLEIKKENLDKAFKDKSHKLFSSDFKVELHYFFS